jgi:hypothetical protein
MTSDIDPGLVDPETPGVAPGAPAIRAGSIFLAEKSQVDQQSKRSEDQEDQESTKQRSESFALSRELERVPIVGAGPGNGGGSDCGKVGYQALTTGGTDLGIAGEILLRTTMRACQFP